MSGPGAGSLGLVLDSSIIVAFERRRFDFERFLAEHAPPVIAAITAGELISDLERTAAGARIRPAATANHEEQHHEGHEEHQETEPPIRHGCDTDRCFIRV